MPLIFFVKSIPLPPFERVATPAALSKDGYSTNLRSKWWLVVTPPKPSGCPTNVGPSAQPHGPLKQPLIQRAVIPTPI
jgi:hypothetical protein